MPERTSEETPREHPIQSWFNRVYGLDVRSLALFRIGLALIILFDLGLRAVDLEAFYSDTGLMPRHHLLENVIGPWLVSAHMMSGLVVFEAVLFVLAAVIAVLLLLGYKTRWMTVLSWFLLISLQGRNVLILHAGDVLLRMLLFWGMFLPLGAAYSLDYALNEKRDKVPQRVFSAASVALFLQIALVYWMTVLFKNAPEWTSEFSAIYYALSLDQFTMPFGYWLLGIPVALPMLTAAVFYYELVGPFLLLSPVWVGALRTLGVLLFIVLHLGLAASINLGIFPWIDIVGFLVLLPSAFWDRGMRLFKTPKREALKIYYDGECGFCKKLVYIIRTFFLIPETAIKTTQSDPIVFQEMEAQNSWVVVDHTGEHTFRFEALIRVIEASPVLWPVGPVLRWQPIYALGTRAYEYVANHRMMFSRWIGWLQFHETTYRSGWFTQGVVTLLLLYTLFWNVGTLNSRWDVPKPAKWIGYVLLIEQKWNMFAPYPSKDDGWYVIPATLMDGRQVDLYTGGGPIRWDKPACVNCTYKNERWQKYLMNLYTTETHPDTLLNYGRYLCRTWNRDLGKALGSQVQSFEIVAMVETTQPDFKPPVLEKRSLWTHYCINLPKEPDKPLD